MKSNESGLTQNWNYVIISVVGLVILTLLVIYLPNLRQIDANILHSVRLALSPYPTVIPTSMAVFGYANNMLWPQIAACSVLISHGKYVKAFLLVFFTQLTFIATHWMKDFTCRERPCVYPGFSFPSTHSSATMCFCGILIYLILKYVRSEFWRYLLVIVFGVYIFMMGVSRMWLGVHYLTDVIAGMFLGFLMVNLFIITSKLLSK